MAATLLNDVIVPEVYANYLVNESIFKSRLYQSGLLAPNPLINQFLSGGGTTLNIPFWKNYSNESSNEPQAIQSGTTLTVNNLNTAKQVGRRLLFGKAWGAEELAGALAGSNPMTAISGMIDNYWNAQIQRTIFAEIKGIAQDSIDNDSSDIVNDIRANGGTIAAANKIGFDAVIDTKAKLGDNSEDFVAIAMHSVPYFTLLKLNAINFLPPNEQGVQVPTYQGLQVIVDDGLTADVDAGNSQPTYWNILFKAGAVQWAENPAGITPVEVDRTAATGTDSIYTRRQFVAHPFGYKWLETSVSGDMPTRDELEEAGNWDKVDEVKNTGITVLLSNG